MAQDPNKDTPLETKLEDLEWPAEEPKDEAPAEEPAPASTEPPPDWKDRTTRTENADGSVDVDLSGLIKDVKTPWRSGDSTRTAMATGSPMRSSAPTTPTRSTRTPTATVSMMPPRWTGGWAPRPCGVPRTRPPTTSTVTASRT